MRRHDEHVFLVPIAFAYFAFPLPTPKLLFFILCLLAFTFFIMWEKHIYKRGVVTGGFFNVGGDDYDGVGILKCVYVGFLKKEFIIYMV